MIDLILSRLEFVVKILDLHLKGELILSDSGLDYYKSKKSRYIKLLEEELCRK